MGMLERLRGFISGLLPSRGAALEPSEPSSGPRPERPYAPLETRESNPSGPHRAVNNPARDALPLPAAEEPSSPPADTLLGRVTIQVSSEPSSAPYRSIASGLIREMVERPDRPCDGCGRRARCAPNKRFGGMLCGPCSLRIVAAERALRPEPSSPPPPRPMSNGERWAALAEPSPALRPEPCQVAALRALEQTYRTFKREPSPAARDSLIQAIHARCGPRATQTG